MPPRKQPRTKEAILAEIEALKIELESTSQRRLEEISKIAKKVGLAECPISNKELEEEFRQIAERFPASKKRKMGKSATKDQEKDS